MCSYDKKNPKSQNICIYLSRKNRKCAIKSKDGPISHFLFFPVVLHKLEPNAKFYQV